jgi:tetratricopeptide (TPR) repeat protein
MTMPLRSVACLLLVASAAVAAPPLDPEANTPYTWRVILTVHPHPTLGPAVKERFVSDLKAALGPALGDDLGTVEIIDTADVPKEKWEPLWKRVGEKGLSALDTDAGEFRTFTGVKTHFLHLKAANGKFTLESRQHDGSTGLASPVARSKTVTDADTLSRTAGLMLAADFGTVGTVEPIPEEKETCLLRARGGDLPGMDRWLKVGDVFQFAVVQDAPRPEAKDAKPKTGKAPLAPPTDRKGQPQPFTLLRVAEVLRPGVARCDIFSRYESPFVRGRSIVGYRALKVSTREGRVSVRLEDKGAPPPPSAPLQVWATEYGARVKPNDRDLLDRREDVFTSPKALRGVAFVTVKLGAGKHEYYPLPVLDHGEPVKLQFGFDEVAVRKARFENTAVRYYNKVLDARLVREELTKAMKGLIEKDEYKAAFERASAGLKNLEEEDGRLTQELAELRKSQDAADPASAGTLATAERLLTALREGNVPLADKIKELEIAVAKQEDPTTYEKKFRANEITRQIAYHERRGEIPEALAEYDKLIEFTDLDEARQRKKTLEEEWKPKSDEQAGLRNYLTETWARLTAREEFDAALPVLQTKIEALAKLDDKFGVRLSLTHIEGAYVRLGELLINLDVDFSEDKEKILAVQKTMEVLKKVEDFAREEQKRLEK